MAEAWATDTHHFRMDRYDGFQKHFDSLQMPDGWDRASFDDSDWSAAAVLAEAAPTLRPRDIPFMHEEAWVPTEVVRVEENMHLNNRMRSGDLSLSPTDIGVDYDVVFPAPPGDVRVTMRDGSPHVTVPDGVELVSSAPTV